MKKIKTSITLIIILSMMLLILDGFSDILVYAKSQINRSHSNGNVTAFLKTVPGILNHETYKQYYNDSLTLKYEKSPGIGQRIISGNYGIYRIDQSGKRLEQENNIEARTKNLLVLGSSQGFGYYSNEKESFTAQLAQQLPEYNIDNYSVPSTTTDQNLANWRRINLTTTHHYDLVLIVNGPMDYYNECWERTAKENNLLALYDELDKYRTPALIDIYQRIKKKLMEDHQEYPIESACYEDASQQIIVQRIMDNFKNLLAYGEKRQAKTLIVIPPMPYGNQANIENVKPTFTKDSETVFGSIVKRLSQLAIQNDKIIDLSTLFDNNPKELFLDRVAHLTPEGNTLVARAVVSAINKNIAEKTTP